MFLGLSVASSMLSMLVQKQRETIDILRVSMCSLQSGLPLFLRGCSHPTFPQACRRVGRMIPHSSQLPPQSFPLNFGNSPDGFWRNTLRHHFKTFDHAKLVQVQKFQCYNLVLYKDYLLWKEQFRRSNGLGNTKQKCSSCKDWLSSVFN